MKRFFISDTHFGHKGIMAFCQRPWEEVHSMNKALTHNWNKIVSDGDIVYHLGDFGFPKLSKFDNYTKHLNGKIILIRGNHDRKSALKNLEWHESLELRIGKYECLLTHRPVYSKLVTWPDKYNDYIKIKELSNYDFFLNGHIHNNGYSHLQVIDNKIVTTKIGYLWNDRNMNLSVEVINYIPLTEEKLISMLDYRMTHISEVRVPANKITEYGWKQ